MRRHLTVLGATLWLIAPDAQALDHGDDRSDGEPEDAAQRPNPPEPSKAQQPPRGSQPVAVAAATKSTKRRRERHARRKKWDYSRFSDGPRWVPRPRGRSLQRAQRLGIGTREAAKKLLRTRPWAALLEAAGDETPRRLLWPVVDGHWGRGFGYTRRVRKKLRHNGVDIAADKGDVVRAAAQGIVVYSDNKLRGLGNCVMIVHPNGWMTLYAHNLRNTVQPGWIVQRGERIALVGQTGIARGAHLHFEFRNNGRLRDPARLFTGYHSDELEGPMVELDDERPDSRRAPRDEAAGEPAGPPAPDPAAPPLGLEIARKLLSQPPSDTLAAAVQGDTFPTVLWPVRGGRVSVDFQPEHRGIDIAAEAGSGVRAAADALVVYAGDGLAGYGHSVVLAHKNGWVTVYGSNRELAVQQGQQLRRGEWIARVGQSGATDQPHLHFELLIEGERRDPSEHLVSVPAADASER